MSIQVSIFIFAFGAGWLQRQAVLPENSWAWMLILMVIALRIPWGSQAVLSVAAKKILWGIFFFSAGFFWAALFAQWRLTDSLPYEWESRDIQLIGIVASLPQSNHRNLRFLFDVEQVLTAGARVPEHISLAWYKTRHQHHETGGVALPQIKAGERWRITVRLKRPFSHANPHGFDFEAWALERNIRATGYVRSSDYNLRLDKMVSHPAYWIERVRQKIHDRFTRILSGEAYAGVLITLATGDQRAITREQWQIFSRTGTNHLVAISGLHITMVSSMVFALVYRLWCWSPYLLLRVPARKIAVIAGLVVALGYTFLSGFSIPAQRAFCMLAVVAIALWRGRITSATTVLTWALLWVILLDPWAVCSPGFWLSFGAIAIIMLVTVGRIGSIHWLLEWVRVQWAITLGLMPLLLGMFQQVSLVSPIANAIAIPLVSLAVVPLTLLATIPMFDFLLLPAHEILSGGMQILQGLSNAPYAVWQQHAPPAWAIIAGVIGVIWILLPGSSGLGFFSGFPARWLGIVALLPMFLIPPSKPAKGELWLTVLDVGQGLAVVARTENYTLLFDSGPGFGETDSGHRIVVPFLRGEGIRQLDTMIVSHADSDHSGGALSVLDSIPALRLISSLNADHPIQQRFSANRYPCHTDISWEWDGVLFESLHPVIQSYQNPKRNTNESSCVLKISTRHGSILLPADIGRQSEQALLDRASNVLPSTVLIAPHHGSKTSSSEAFIRQVNPELTIFTVGYRNRFRHPDKEVAERYRQSGSKLLRSDIDGAVSLRFSNNGIEVETWRARYRRYWQ